jgi:Protein of unknown function (DUF3108)
VAPARILVAACAALAVAPAGGARAETAPAGTAAVVERYVYLASPQDTDSASAETHTVTITSTPTGAAYAFDIRFGDGLVDRGVVTTTASGDLETAARRRYGRDGAIYESDSLRVDGATLVMQTWRDGDTKTSRAECPRDRPVAADASLLLWMRRFPFGDSGAHDVFMADWSHRTVDVDVRDRGIETIAVPAGTFACHRMEVTVRVLVFRPKITFWITVDAPHVLVQHRGKRGPFTPVFETRLLRIETP